jgi:hypothetical protein
VGALLLSIGYPVLRYLSPPRVPEATTRQVEAGAVNDPELLQRGFKIVRFGAEPVILIRVAEEDFRAFSATCTHTSPASSSTSSPSGASGAIATAATTT